jgi:hypothetical protein
MVLCHARSYLISLIYLYQPVLIHKHDPCWMDRADPTTFSRGSAQAAREERRSTNRDGQDEGFLAVQSRGLRSRHVR